MAPPLDLYDIRLNAEDICVPIGDCFTVAPGLALEQVVTKLIERGFDQAPVIDRNGRVCGLADRIHLESILEYPSAGSIHRR